VTPWDVRLARLLVRPLRHTRLSPNAITTAGLLASLGAAALVATGRPRLEHVGAGLFVVSVLADHMDGEFARLTGRTSRFGHYYDHVAAGLGCVSLFAGLGIGQSRGPLGGWALVAGGVAAAALTLIFAVRVAVEETRGRAMVAQANLLGFEPEDALYLVAPVTWLGGLAPLLVATAIGTAVFLLWVGWCALAGRSATAPRASGAARRQGAAAPPRAREGGRRRAASDGSPLTR
jgi:phosphatidylglycerophosphate synthase